MNVKEKPMEGFDIVTLYEANFRINEGKFKIFSSHFFIVTPVIIPDFPNSSYLFYSLLLEKS